MSENHYAKSDASAAGAVLAAAREELNLSVADVARHLKLSPAQVEALEEGAYERLPGRVFVRGFLRNYAKLLGLDPQPLLRRLDHEMPQPPVEDERPPATPAVMPTGERARWPLYAGIAATIIVALAAYEFGFNSPPAPAPEPATSTTPAEATTVAPAAGLTASAAPAPLTDTPAPLGSGPVALAPPSPPGEAAAAEATARAAGAPRAEGERELRLRFEEESWVEIRDRDGKVIFSKLNRPGAEERVVGAPPLKLVIGNARGVRLEMDNQPVDLAPHTRVAVARLTLQ